MVIQADKDFIKNLLDKTSIDPTIKEDAKNCVQNQNIETEIAKCTISIPNFPAPDSLSPASPALKSAYGTITTAGAVELLSSSGPGNSTAPSQTKIDNFAKKFQVKSCAPEGSSLLRVQCCINKALIDNDIALKAGVQSASGTVSATFLAISDCNDF